MSTEHAVVYEEHPQYGPPRATCSCGVMLTAENIGSALFPVYSIAAALAAHLRRVEADD